MHHTVTLLTVQRRNIKQVCRDSFHSFCAFNPCSQLMFWHTKVHFLIVSIQCYTTSEINNHKTHSRLSVLWRQVLFLVFFSTSACLLCIQWLYQNWTMVNTNNDRYTLCFFPVWENCVFENVMFWGTIRPIYPVFKVLQIQWNRNGHKGHLVPVDPWWLKLIYLVKKLNLSMFFFCR